MTDTALGRRIVEERNKRGWSLNALAEESGLLVQTINAIERGISRTPRIATLQALADALEIPMDDLAKDAYAASA